MMPNAITGILKDDVNLRNLIMQAPVAMAFFRGKDFIVELINDKALQILGTSVDLVINEPFLKVYPEFIEMGIDKELEMVFQSGLPFYANERALKFMRHGKPDTVYVDFTFHAMKDFEGSVIGIIAIGVDVTEKRISRNQLIESERKYKGLFHSMTQGFCIMQMIFDKDKKPVDFIYVEVNPAFIELTGIKDVIGKKARELFPGAEESWFEIYGNVALTGEEITFTAPSAVLGRWFDVYAFPVNTDSSFTVAALFTDISERKRKEHAQEIFAQDLKEMVEKRTIELQNSNEELEQFAHVVSHDLKEPVRKMAIIADLLITSADMSSPITQSYLKKIYASGVRLQNTIDEILRHSSMNNIIDLTIEDVDLNETIQTILSDLEHILNEKEAVVNVGNLPVIKGSSVLINQLFYNLIANSLKFTRLTVQPQINISYRHHVRKSTEIAEIIVKDNGLGFDQQYSKKIFESAFRLLPKTEFPGTGFGLAICKKIARKHGGSIVAHSNLNAGSIFTVLLPMKINEFCL